jgi:DNA-binding NarL/FixJ family response regulator
MDGNGKRSGNDGRREEQGHPLSPERLKELFATIASHNSDRRLLLESIRLTLDELRSLRASFEGRRARDAGMALVNRPPMFVLLQQHYNLTPRESEVAILLTQGASNVDIASALGISPHTARHHTQAVLSKVGARSRAEVGAKVRG